MNLRQAYLGMIKAFPGGWDAMSAALGFKRDSLENRIYERKGMDVPVQVALQMQEFSGTTLFAEAVCVQAGGTFVKLPSIDHIDDEDISAKFHEVFEELGELSAEFRAATKDGEVDSREREKLNGLVDQIHQTMDELRALTFKYYCHETKSRTASSINEAR